MACRYFDHPEHQGHARICRACDPEREPTRAEQKVFCQAPDQQGCAFFRFRRATGRPLLFEDYLAWERRRSGSDPTPADLEPAAGEPL